MENNSLETPVTNRGVTHTIDNRKAHENKGQIENNPVAVVFKILKEKKQPF